MSFTHVAKASGVARGNINYHYKTKRALLESVIAGRRSRAQATLKRWESEEEDPLARLKRFTRVSIVDKKQLVEFGCPMGSLATELAKNPELKSLARLQLDDFRVWLAAQFEALAGASDSDQRAVRLIARTQGVAVLAHAYGDVSMVQTEIEAINDWLDGLVS